MNLDLTQWFEALCLIHSSRPQLPVDGVVVYSRSHGRDGDGLLEAVRELFPNTARSIVINGGNGEGTNGQPAWPGKDAYIRSLVELGIPNSRIILAPPAPHTQAEGMAFAEVINDRGWTRVAVVNAGHVLPRSLLSLLFEMHKQERQIKLFPVAPTCLSWQVKVHGQQGSAPDERFKQCAGELQRCLEYPGKYPGKFVELQQLIDHLKSLNE